MIPLGFDLQPFLDSGEHRGAFYRELGLTNGARLVGIVGRIFPIKNHRLFLDAAARVAAEERSARFVVVGDGALRPEMEAHARRLGIADRVTFTGWRRDLPRIYPDLDVLVVSSKNEGTPVSAIEAMASGCPVVATRVGGLPDLIDGRGDRPSGAVGGRAGPGRRDHPGAPRHGGRATNGAGGPRARSASASASSAWSRTSSVSTRSCWRRRASSRRCALPLLARRS